MSNVRSKIESFFEKAGRWLFQNPKKVLICILLFIGFFGYQIPSITIDTTIEALLHENDPSLLEYNSFRDQFGRAELIIIAVQGSEIFKAGFLNKLKSFHETLEEEVPYLREVSSLINVRNTKGVDDELIVEGLLEDWPEKYINLADLKDQVTRNPFYLNYLISEDGRVTAVVIETEATVREAPAEDDILSGFDEDKPEVEQPVVKEHYFSEKENREVVDAVNLVVKRFHSEDFALTVSGGPVIMDALSHAIIADIKLCILLALTSVTIFLAILFRRLSAVILPIFIIVSVLISTLGLMALAKVTIKLITIVVPVFLVSVSVCDSVHVLAIFYRRLGQGDEKEAAIVFALGHSGIAIVMTSLTTIAGLLSFSFAELTAIAEIGLFAACGVMLALVFTIAMLPALLALTSMKPTLAQTTKFVTMDRLLGFIAMFSTAHPFKLLIAGLVIFAVLFPNLFKLKVSHNVVEFFPDSMPYRTDLYYIDKELKGTISLEIILDTNQENGVYDPWILNQIEGFSRRTENFKYPNISVGKVFSITDILKEIHQALNENNPVFYQIPQDRNVVAQEFLLFENSGADDLGRIVDGHFSKTRITIKSPWVDAVVCREFMDDISLKLKEIFGNRTEIHATGLMALLARTIVAAIYSMVRSYVIAFLVVTILMILLIGDLKIGLVSMIPNLLPILITMGLMGILDIPLDLNSLLIGSIAMGIVVDDTIHFIYNFQRYYNKTADSFFAVRETLLGTGRALLTTSLVLCTGFFIMMAASLNQFVKFGFFTGITILLALLADFLLAPAFMVLLKKGF
jgi:hypothetical protein